MNVVVIVIAAVDIAAVVVVVSHFDCLPNEKIAERQFLSSFHGCLLDQTKHKIYNLFKVEIMLVYSNGNTDTNSIC